MNRQLNRGNCLCVLLALFPLDQESWTLRITGYARRQKTYLVEALGQTHFEDVLMVNLENDFSVLAEGLFSP